MTYIKIKRCTLFVTFCYKCIAFTCKLWNIRFTVKYTKFEDGTIYHLIAVLIVGYNTTIMLKTVTTQLATLQEEISLITKSLSDIFKPVNDTNWIKNLNPMHLNLWSMSIMSQVAKLYSVYLCKSMQCHITIISSKIREQNRENSETIVSQEKYSKMSARWHA